MLVGLVLLAAAGLKLSGLEVSPYAQFGWLSTSWVQLAAIEWELVLGIWLISGLYARVGTYAGVFTFLTFGIVSCYLGIVGQASCGCFGTVEISPWIAFAVDVLAIGVLLIGYPRVIHRSVEFTGFVGVICGSILLLCISVALCYILFGSAPAALAKLRGEKLTAPQYLDLGHGKPGEVLEGTVSIQNWSDQPVRLIGGTTDCSCVTTSELPITIPAGESRTVKVMLKIPIGEQGQFTRTAMFMTDYDHQRTIQLHLGCYADDAVK